MQNGTMCYWRFKGVPTEWKSGYYMNLGNGMARMGAYYGDTDGGAVVRESEIETERYSR